MAGKPRPVHITEKDRQIATELLEGKSIIESLVGHGYNENYANKGQAALTKGIKAALLEHGMKYDWMGSQLLDNPKLIESSVVGFLYESMLKRSAKGVTAAKLLGQHRKVDMFASESQNNVLVIQAPSGWQAPDVKYQPEKVPDALPPSDAELPDYE